METRSMASTLMSAAAVLLVATLLAQPTRAQDGTLLEDHFTDGNYDGWTVMHGTWSAATLALQHLTSPPEPVGSARISTHAGDVGWTDYQIDVRVLPDPEGEFDGDVYVRLAADNSITRRPTTCYGLFFKHRPQGDDLQLIRIVDGVETELYSGLTPSAGEFDISLSVAEVPGGTRFAVDLNGVTAEVIDNAPDRPLYGGVGFRSWYVTEGQSFDDVVVTEITGPVSTTPITWGALKSWYATSGR